MFICHSCREEIRAKLPKGRSYQIAAFIPSDPEVGDPISPSQLNNQYGDL